MFQLSLAIGIPCAHDQFTICKGLKMTELGRNMKPSCVIESVYMFC
jgi:hypothetical protein